MRVRAPKRRLGRGGGRSSLCSSERPDDVIYCELSCNGFDPVRCNNNNNTRVPLARGFSLLGSESPSEPNRIRGRRRWTVGYEKPKPKVHVTTTRTCVRGRYAYTAQALPLCCYIIVVSCTGSHNAISNNSAPVVGKPHRGVNGFRPLDHRRSHVMYSCVHRYIMCLLLVSRKTLLSYSAEYAHTYIYI